mmetsp:Transcript_2283/g.3597  ORF Transcript_2283/g.3597 Transcript_2283/m.3597 type:complete len:343 (+) Transcript_2283:446-1474(+)
MAATVGTTAVALLAKNTKDAAKAARSTSACTSTRRTAAASTAAHTNTPHSTAMMAPSTGCRRRLQILHACCASDLARRSLNESPETRLAYLLNNRAFMLCVGARLGVPTLASFPSANEGTNFTTPRRPRPAANMDRGTIISQSAAITVRHTAIHTGRGTSDGATKTWPSASGVRMVHRMTATAMRAPMGTARRSRSRRAPHLSAKYSRSMSGCVKCNVQGSCSMGSYTGASGPSGRVRAPNEDDVSGAVCPAAWSWSRSWNPAPRRWLLLACCCSARRASHRTAAASSGDNCRGSLDQLSEPYFPSPKSSLPVKAVDAGTMLFRNTRDIRGGNFTLLLLNGA